MNKQVDKGYNKPIQILMWEIELFKLEMMGFDAVCTSYAHVNFDMDEGRRG